MAAAPDPGKVLCSTSGKDNFQRVTRLLISGGTTSLREIFDQICLPSNLPAILQTPATKKQLATAKLTKPQWDCLYPSPGVYGESCNFDVTLLFRLLRTICNLTPPVTGWDALPASTDHSLEADLARIKYYRNSVYGHVNQNMEITDDGFLTLWQEISEAIERIAGQISSAKKHEWQKAIDAFLKDPLTAEDERNVEELQRWYDNDTEVKQSIDKLKSLTLEGMESVERSVKGVHEKLEGTAHSVEEKGQFLENVIQEEAKGIKDQLGGELTAATQNVYSQVQEKSQDVQCLVREEAKEIKGELREEAQDIKDKLDEVHQSIDGLRSTAGSSQPAGVQIRLRVDCEAISGSGPTGVASGLVATSQKPQRSVQSATAMPFASYQQTSAPVAEFRGDNVPYEGLPPTQTILDFIAHRYIEAVNPSTLEELNGFVKYLNEVRKALIVEAQQGSLIITLECRSLEILDNLWQDYCSGHLTEVAQKYLVTEELLDEFGLAAVKLTITILQKEYAVCRQYFLQSEVHSSRYDPKRRRVGFGPREETFELFSAAALDPDRSMPVHSSDIQIVIEMPDKLMIPLKVDPSYTIKRVKQLIELKKGFPLYQQELIFASEILEDDHTLSDYNINGKSTLHLILDSTNMQIFIQWPTGDLIGTFKVEPNTPINDLKKKIEKSGFATDGKRLVFEGCELKDRRTLKHYNIKNESTLTLSPPLSGIFVTTPYDNKGRGQNNCPT